MAPLVAIKELGPAVIGVMWAETALAIPFVILRLYCRAALHKAPVGWDDWLMLASLALFVAYSATCTAATRSGFGRHMGELEMAQFAEANKLEIIGETMLIAAIATSKTSIAVFLLRITIHLWHRIVLWTSIVTLGIMCFLCASLNFFQCNPIRHVWNPTVPAHCWMSVTPLAIATGAYSIVIDVLLAALPWSVVWTLNMPKKERLYIAGSLSLGLFAGVCGIVRTYELQGLSRVTDYSYGTVSLVLWSASELLITIICANIPLLRPLYTKKTGSTANAGSGASPAAHASYFSKRPSVKTSDTWTELDDVDMAATLAAETKRGQNKTTIRHQRSDEFGLREDSESDNIRVRADVRIGTERI